ncbi:hypothetical protein HY992_01700 [Candidatus Micrarchaeota archaeon]|nr:hypothetical protein [Candidatus Micrarchaeota archaeon]
MAQRVGVAKAEVIASANKLEGWKNYERSRDVFLRAHQWSTRREFLELHDVVCASSANGFPSIAANDFEFLLTVQDRRDGAGLERRLQEFARRNPDADFHQVTQALFEFACEGVARAELETRTTGVLRVIGTRKLASGEKEIVYGSHECEFGEDAQGPRGYYGFSSDLQCDHLYFYNLLCDLFDEKMKPAQTIEEKLKAIAWFQIVGTRLIHPPWDGTGRTFSAHLDLTLARIGFEEASDAKAGAWVHERCKRVTEQAWQKAQQDYPGLDQVNFSVLFEQAIAGYSELDSPRALLVGRVLADFSNYILRLALEGNRLGYIRLSAVPLMLSPSKRLAYMKALGNGINDAIHNTDEKTLETATAYLSNLVKAPLEVARRFSTLMKMCYYVPDQEDEMRRAENHLNARVTDDGFTSSPAC